MNIDTEKLLDEADLLVATSMYDQAISKYNYILENAGNNDEALLMRGALLGEMGQIDNAISDVEKSIKLNNANDSAFATLAYLHAKKNNFDKAIELCRSSISINKNNHNAINLQVQLCTKLGNEMLSGSQLEKAESYFNLALECQNNNAGLLYKLVLVARGRGEIERSIKLAEKVLGIDPNHIRAKAHIASSYELLGDADKGDQLIEALFHEYPNHPLVNIIFAQYAIRTKKQEEGIYALEKMIARHDIQNEDMVSAKMFLGKLYDSVGQYDTAFKYFSQANESLGDNYDPVTYQNYISTLINYFSKEKYASIQSSNNKSNELIFIMGVPRSGTSLVEQIISSHSNVFGAGELTHVNNMVESIQREMDSMHAYPECMDDATIDNMNALADKLISNIRGNEVHSTRISDKLPHNFHHIGLIHKLLPNAKFINCVRDAKDTCLSCYFQYFTGYHPYASNLRALGIHYLEYERLMNHWINELGIPVLTVSYENVVSDTKTEVRRILDFLELDWQEQCMEFYKQKRKVATASYDQVNKKIYSSSVNKWKNYREYISELLETLGER